MRRLIAATLIAAGGLAPVETMTSRAEISAAEAARAADTVYDGVAGLERALSGGYELILLDLMLPGMYGMDVCKQVRERSDVPIVMLTARTLEDDQVRGLELGADDYIVKPFSPRQVVARIRSVLRRQGAMDGTLRFASVELHGGRITVASAPTDGTTFEISLPQGALEV